jgi:hypothetical protein
VYVEPSTACSFSAKWLTGHDRKLEHRPEIHGGGGNWQMRQQASFLR